MATLVSSFSRLIFVRASNRVSFGFFVAMGKPTSQRATKRKRNDDEDQAKQSEASNKDAEGTPSSDRGDESDQGSKHPRPDSAHGDTNDEAHDQKPWNLKICSWNVNGVRAWLGKEGLSFLEKENPDVFAIQETKCSDAKLPKEVKDVEGYHSYFLAGDQEGYSGVGLLSKIKPLDVKYGIGKEEHDKEGRVITAEFDKFYLVATYVPNAGKKLVRLNYRMDWDKDFRAYLKELETKKPVVLCGDLNVAHQEIDIANPKGNKRNAGFTQEERDGFTTLLNSGFLDSFRHLYPKKEKAYTFWTYMMNARAKDVGWRLDYFVLSKSLEKNLSNSIILKDVMGSDHCPITLLLNL
uniref:DNA-(apurinic or apyrimidinic site) endonuclease n=2 Tax=Ixodes ricinus TaxID=34613 RepID=V5IDJ2_IXORI